MRAQAQRADGVLQSLANVETDRIQFHAARLDLREIENIIDNRKQRVG